LINSIGNVGGFVGPYRWKGDPQRRQRIQMVLLRESEMTQPAIAGRSNPSRAADASART
jgi:hypothetical protein